MSPDGGEMAVYFFLYNKENKPKYDCDSTGRKKNLISSDVSNN